MGFYLGNTQINGLYLGSTPINNVVQTPIPSDGLITWWDASNVETTSSAGGYSAYFPSGGLFVTKWLDKSGYQNHASSSFESSTLIPNIYTPTTLALPPQYSASVAAFNSKPVVYFQPQASDYTPMMLYPKTLMPSGSNMARSIFIVGSNNSGTNNNGTFIAEGPTNSPSASNVPAGQGFGASLAFHVAPNVGNGPALGAYGTLFNNPDVTEPVLMVTSSQWTTSISSPFVWGYKWNDWNGIGTTATSSLLVNSASFNPPALHAIQAIKSTGSYEGKYTQVIGSALTTNDPTTVSNVITSCIAEVVVYDRFLNTAETTQVLEYLRLKYNLY